MIAKLSTTDIETASKADLIDKIKELENINHMIAHNLRGSAANIIMLAAILQERNISDPANENGSLPTGEAIDGIYQCSNALLNTLGGLMELVDAKLNDRRKDPCDIECMVDAIKDQLTAFIHQRNATIELKLDVPNINYPAQYLESMLYNFINNALKYARTDVPLKIVVSTYVQNGRTVLTVKDNGLGIDLEAFGSRIFKLNEVFHSGYESKGIGLYITKTQIEALGGSISVKSKVNEGSEFIVIF